MIKRILGRELDQSKDVSTTIGAMFMAGKSRRECGIISEYHISKCLCYDVFDRR